MRLRIRVINRNHGSTQLSSIWLSLDNKRTLVKVRELSTDLTGVYSREAKTVNTMSSWQKSTITKIVLTSFAAPGNRGRFGSKGPASPFSRTIPQRLWRPDPLSARWDDYFVDETVLNTAFSTQLDSGSRITALRSFKFQNTGEAMANVKTRILPDSSKDLL